MTRYPRAIADIITSVDEIEAILGRPNRRIVEKELNALDDICLTYIARSPFVVVASADAAGRLDVSPKGDHPGFVRVLDPQTLAIPERPGNRRADTFRNVLQNPRVGLIFVIPGHGETLRVSGRAQIARDSWLCEPMAVDGRAPKLALVVSVEQAFMHCPKCFIRARMWQPETWNTEGLLNSAESMMVHADITEMTLAELQERRAQDIRDNLY